MSTYTWHVYGLADPETGLVHYVGQSRRVAGRYRDHVSLSALKYKKINERPKPRDLWIESVKASGREPELLVFDTIATDQRSHAATPDVVYELEVAWIDRLLAAGHPLTNEPEPRHNRVRRKVKEADLMERAVERGRNLALSLGKGHR